MTGPADDPLGATRTSMQSPEELRWLHDKYERLAAEEGQLSGTRTSYFAAIGTVLVTGFVVAIVNLITRPLVLVATVSFLTLLGVALSFIWAVLLHRTNDAQRMFREAALRLEEHEPPLAGTLAAPITLRSGRTIEVNLLRPFRAHAQRFAATAPISWLDRVNPTALTELLPLVFIGVWAGAAASIWVWFLYFA